MRSLFLSLLLLLSLPLSADRHRPCRHSLTQTRAMEAPAAAFTGNHRALIILAAFPDKQFSSADANAVWSDIANEPGYSEHGANGSVADYFTAQSEGQFNLTFDVVGPVQLPRSYSFYGQNNSSGDDMWVGEMIKDACTAADARVNFADYDWDGDKRVEMVFVLYAGMGENDSGPEDTVWPVKSSTYLMLDGVRISTYACCNEIAGDGVSLSGMGVLCHEFSHCLGLPDLYPLSGSVTSTFDEWDLMDGGCYSNEGWTPVGYSAYEKMLCGWYSPVELTDNRTVSGVKPMQDGGDAYILRSDSRPSDYYVLELRKWKGWDYYLPGEGLFVTHVNGSSVSPVCADNQPYAVSSRPMDNGEMPWYNEQGRSNALRNAAYPYLGNDSLTANSRPANTIGKPITGITAGETASFTVRQSPNDDTAVRPLLATDARDADILGCYDLQGRRLGDAALKPGTIYIIRYKNGTVKHFCR